MKRNQTKMKMKISQEAFDVLKAQMSVWEGPEIKKANQFEKGEHQGKQDCAYDLKILLKGMRVEE